MVHHQVLPFVEVDLSFDPPTTAILRTAYDAPLRNFMIEALTAFGMPLPDGSSL